jgi:hypothetical protein
MALDRFRHRSAQSKPPAHLLVPRVRIERKWPTFSDSRIDQPYSPENVILELELLWSRLAEPIDDISATDFWGATTQFFFDGDDEASSWYGGSSNQPIIAIANYRNIEVMWSEFLPRLQLSTYPPKEVLLVMVREAFASYDVDAWQMMFHGYENWKTDDWFFEYKKIISFLDVKIQQAVDLLRPTMHMFFSSIWAQRANHSTTSMPKIENRTIDIESETLGPFAVKHWAAILGIDEKTFRNRISDGKYTKHRQSGHARTILLRQGLPQDIEALILEWKGGGTPIREFR